MFQLIETNMSKLFRITVGILILSLCLQVSPLPISESNINLMQRHVKCEPNLTLYTPENVKPECMTSALDCFTRELKGTVKAECNDTREYVDDAVEAYDNAMKEWQEQGFPLTSIGCTSCELWPQTPFNKFLSKLETLLQMQESMSKSSQQLQG